jgi:hypothetical protein
MCKVITAPRRLYNDLRELVVLNVGDFFGDTPGTVRSHGEDGVQSKYKGAEGRAEG